VALFLRRAGNTRGNTSIGVRAFLHLGGAMRTGTGDTALAFLRSNWENDRRTVAVLV
jgi:hypothetical protein